MSGVGNSKKELSQQSEEQDYIAKERRWWKVNNGNKTYDSHWVYVCKGLYKGAEMPTPMYKYP